MPFTDGDREKAKGEGEKGLSYFQGFIHRCLL